jgi:hypothetical protein
MTHEKRLAIQNAIIAAIFLLGLGLIVGVVVVVILKALEII